MASQPPLSAKPNIFVESQIPVPSSQPLFLKVRTSAPLSSQHQLVDGTDIDIGRSCIIRVQKLKLVIILVLNHSVQTKNLFGIYVE